MKIGYARTSTIEQKAGFEAQLRDLKAVGVEKVFQEQLSSVDAKREQLEAAIEWCREGDVLVCTKLDRLARSVADVVAIERRLNDKGAALHIMDPAMDTSSPAGRLVFNVLASIAQFEREIMLTRQREGIARAKGEGKYKGRAPTARAKAAEVHALIEQGVGATDIAKRLGIGRRSVYRVIEAATPPPAVSVTPSVTTVTPPSLAPADASVTSLTSAVAPAPAASLPGPALQPRRGLPLA